MVRAPTGSGKTLAYAIPIIQVDLSLIRWRISFKSLLHRKVPCLRCLVVVPTRDLVQQVFDVINRYCGLVVCSLSFLASSVGQI